MPRTPKNRTAFGERVHAIRRARGMTQTQLAEAAGMSQRMVSHYECEIENPSADMVLKLAIALSVSTDELLGHKPVRKMDESPAVDPVMMRYWKRLRTVATLKERDRRAVLRMIDSLAKG